jgi:hypothetical protein
MKPFKNLLIVYLAPPLAALLLAVVLLIAIWPDGQHPDPRPTGTVGVRKGPRLGSPDAGAAVSAPSIANEQQPVPPPHYEYR